MRFDLLALVTTEAGKQSIRGGRGENPSLIVDVPDGDAAIAMERGIEATFFWPATLRAVCAGGVRIRRSYLDHRTIYGSHSRTLQKDLQSDTQQGNSRKGG